MLPNPHIKEFDLANARALAELSALAYREPAQIEAAVQGRARFFGFISDAATDTQGFVVADDKAIVLVFRGTSSVADTLTDLKFRKQVFDDGGVHRGFLSAWRGVSAEARAAVLEAFRAGSRPLFITGHSLGGALACMAGEQFSARTSVYTFGQPRVGNSGFAGKMGPYFYRVVHEEDPVPRLPLWVLGYRHSGQEVFLDSFGHIRFSPPLQYKLLSDVWGIVDAWSREKLAALPDHGIANYIERLSSHPTLYST